MKAMIGLHIILWIPLLLSGCSGNNNAAEEAKPPMKKQVWKSKLAGTWYSDSPEELKKTISEFFDKTSGEVSGTICALILPHAGYRFSGQVACQTLGRIKGRKFERVVVLGPSHRVAMSNQVSVPTVTTHYATPLGETPLDTAFIKKLSAAFQVTSRKEAHADEHSVQIQLPLLQSVLGNFKFVPIVVGSLDLKTADQLGKILLGLIDDKTLVVASSDFIHYGPRFGYTPFTTNLEKSIEELDMEGFKLIQARALKPWYAFLEKKRPTICGRNAIAVLMAMLNDKNRVQLVKYDTSGRMTGNFTNSVSYIGAVVTGAFDRSAGKKIEAHGPELDGESQQNLLKLARATVTWYFKHRRTPTAEDLGIPITPNMKKQMGAFVTLKKRGRLRGCIGEYPRREVYKAVIEMALASAFRDSRFGPLAENELKEVTFEISALSPYRVVDSYSDIVIGRHGIIIEKHGQRAVYLPQVAPEQGWNLEETLSHLSRKAGLPADAWKQGATFRVFEAKVFHEPGAE